MNRPTTHRFTVDRDRWLKVFFVLREESGQSLLVFSLFLTILIGMLGIVLDLGYANVMQRQMQIAADAAALAGARDLALGEPESTAIARMQQMLTANKADATLSSYTVTNGSTTDVVARISVPTLISGLFGLDKIEIDAHANAATGQVTQADTLMPFVIQEGQWAVGESVALWEDDKTGPGNFGWVHWAGQNSSANILGDNIDDLSRSDTLSIGDLVSGATGNMFKAVESNLSAWIGKTVTVILYDPDEVHGNGSHLTYTVRGFAYFRVTGTDSKNKEILGDFVSYVPLGGTINPEVKTGAQGVVLLH